MNLFLPLSDWLAKHINNISIAIVAASLFIYSAPINRFVQRQLRPLNFLARLSMFILVSSIGFGMAMAGGVSLTRHILLSINRPFLAPIVALIFLVIGFIAERKRHM